MVKIPPKKAVGNGISARAAALKSAWAKFEEEHAAELAEEPVPHAKLWPGALLDPMARLAQKRASDRVNEQKRIGKRKRYQDYVKGMPIYQRGTRKLLGHMLVSKRPPPVMPDRDATIVELTELDRHIMRELRRLLAIIEAHDAQAAGKLPRAYVTQLRAAHRGAFGGWERELLACVLWALSVPAGVDVSGANILARLRATRVIPETLTAERIDQAIAESTLSPTGSRTGKRYYVTVVRELVESLGGELGDETT